MSYWEVGNLDQRVSECGLMVHEIVQSLWGQGSFRNYIHDTDQASWPSPININSLQARQEIQARLYWGSCCSSGEWEQEIPLLASLLSGACSLYGVSVGVCPGFGIEGMHRRFANLSGGVVCRGYDQYLAFAPQTLSLGCSEVASGFFGLFVSFVQNLP